MFRNLITCHLFSKYQPSDKILVFASSVVGFPTVRKIAERYGNTGLQVVTHYSPPNRKNNNEVQLFCRDQNIKCYFPIKSKEDKQKQWEQFIDEASQNGLKWPKLGVVCSFGYMIPQKIIASFGQGSILVHPSLIPKYRGGAPIFHTIANGDTNTGITYMELSPQKFDCGNVLHTVTHQLGENCTYKQIEHQLAELASDHVCYVIDNIDSLKPGISQDSMDISGISPHQLKAPLVKDKKLDISMPAESVYNWSRALVTPKVRFRENDIILSFMKEFLQDNENEYKPGQVVLKGKKKLYMKCGDRLIRLKGWQQPTKGQLPIHTFLDRFIDRKNYEQDIFFS